MFEQDKKNIYKYALQVYNKKFAPTATQCSTKAKILLQ
jgi:hypothetical protein